MTEFERMRSLSERNKRLYPPGTRIELLRMADEPFPVRSGTRGTVVACDDGGNVLMEWDDGRTLALRPDIDRFRVLSQEECENEEQEGVGPCQTCHEHRPLFRRWGCHPSDAGSNSESRIRDRLH